MTATCILMRCHIDSCIEDLFRLEVSREVEETVQFELREQKV
jgi:hypothetical protein